MRVGVAAACDDGLVWWRGEGEGGGMEVAEGQCLVREGVECGEGRWEGGVCWRGRSGRGGW